MIANQGPRRSAAGRSVVRPLPAQFEPGRRSQLARRHAAQPRTLRRLARAGAGGRRAAQRRLRRLGLLGRHGPPGHREGGDRARRLLGTVRLVRRGRGGGDRLARRRRSRRGGVGGRRLSHREAALSLGKRGDKLAASLDLEGLGTAGYQVVASPGLVDHAASSRRVSGRARVAAGLAPEFTAFAGVGGFGESEDSGTRYTTASAREAEVVAGVTAGSFDLKAFARQASFDQDRARLLPDAFARASEQLASSQAAPADDEGLSLQYASGGLVAGPDARRVFGRSQEALHPAPLSAAAMIARNASGDQQQAGIFVEEVLSPYARRSGE